MLGDFIAFIVFDLIIDGIVKLIKLVIRGIERLIK
jgi:hypothetical protein